MPKTFTQSQLQAIADALGDTTQGLTGSEIAHLLASCGITDVTPELTKRRRLYNAFAAVQNASQDRVPILAFIRKSMKPELYARCPERFEPMRADLNRALLFCGLSVDQAGVLESATVARTLTEAQRRASELRADLELRNVHPDVLRFCREELLADNYFHAVLEAAKSIAEKIRQRTGLTSDGSLLVDQTLAGDLPVLAINAWSTESEKSEQKGFANLVKGIFGMFRNTTAHAPKISWAINKDDAEEVLGLISFAHRRLDGARMLPRA